MASNPLYNHSLVNLYRSIGTQMGFSPAFQNASAAQGISESSLNPNAVGDSGASFGLHQWNRKASPERYQSLLNVSKQMGLPPTDPRVQITHWYNENQANKGISDPTAANAAAIASERPAGWKPGDPTGVPSYGKRLGDTMALMRLANGQTDPQDPRSFQATGTDEQANAGLQPSGAQSISLGDQENQQPLNNIGSTLANMGAAIASLDRHGTGIASLNASHVASNLAAQEAAREKEGGWKYQGQTDNKQGFIFANGKGETKIIPADPQFAGQNEPETIRTLRMLADPANKNLLETKQAINGKESNVDEQGNWKYSTPVEDIDKKIERAENGETMQSVLSRGNQKSRDDFNHRLVELGKDPSVFAASAAEQAGKMNEFRKFGADLAVTERIAPKLMADIDIARQKLADYQKVAPTGNIVPLNKLMGMTQEQMTGPGAKELASLKTALKDVFDTHARYLGNGAITEASRQQSNDLASPFSAEPVTSAVLDTIASHTVRNQDFQRKGYANMTARNKKQALPYPELELDPEGKTKKSTSLPSVGKKTTINGVEIERLE